MRKTLPVFLGLALALGSAGFAQTAGQDKEKVKVEKNGDVKVKGKTYDETGTQKYKTKVKNEGDVTKDVTKMKTKAK